MPKMHTIVGCLIVYYFNIVLSIEESEFSSNFQSDSYYIRRALSENSGRQSYLFYVIIGFIILACGAYNACFKRRLEAEMLRNQVHQEQTYRHDVIASDEDMNNLWECDICQFKNYQIQKTCMLCGTDRGYKLYDKIPTKSGNEDSLHISTSSPTNDFAFHESSTPTTLSRLRSFAKSRLRGLNPRQLGARRRHEWLREENDAGEVVWKRNKNNMDRVILKSLRKEKSNVSTSESEDSRDSNSSIISIGYVSHLIMTPKHPDGRMTFELAEGSGASRTNGVESFHRDESELEEVSNLPFQQKIAWFVQHTASMEIPWEYGHMLMEIDRTNLLHNSCEQLLWASSEQLHQSMRIKFLNEPGVDAGGLEREWFTLMTEEVFNESTGLFLPTMSNNSYAINPQSNEASEDHLMYFQAIGRFLGRAIFQGILIEAHLALPLYKHILGEPITFSDLQFIDMELYRNLKWLRENTGVESLDLDFSVTVSRYGKPPMIVELRPNGAQIPVTDANKQEYIDLRLKWVMVTSISEQLASLLKGVFSVIPKYMLSIFDHQELELLMCGVPEINIQDWKEHTTYIGDHRKELIEWFWETIEEFSNEQRARLLQFTTGSARVPVQGFKALTMNDGRICHFAIQTIPKEECAFPRAHTCFNRLDLPRYSSKEELKTTLSTVINLEVTGFTME